MSDYRLEMKGIIKEFLSLRALDNAQFKLRAGEVHALLGINGAGKSTLIKVLSGVYKREQGEIFIDGKPVEINQPNDAMKAGIATVYQDPQMVTSFTGYENIFLGSESEKKGAFAQFNRKKMKKKAEELLKEFPLEIDLNKPIFKLSAVEKEIIAVLRALSKRSNILILDEPTSILTEKEKHTLFDLIKMLKKKGVSIIYITHHLDEVSEICDSMTIFRNGQNVATLPVKQGEINTEHIAELMLGKKLEAIYPNKSNTQNRECILKVDNLFLENKFKDISFNAKKGEVLGIFGLVGSGIDELSKVLFGAMSKTGGKMNINGKEVQLSSPKSAIDNGIFLVPGDRRHEGQIGEQTIATNLTLSKLEKITNNIKLVNRKQEAIQSNELVEKLQIATTGIDKKVRLLSGGNQQKVVIGKGLFTDAKVYIFSEPTIGVDVGAKAGIYNTMRELSKDSAVIIISSDCEEVLGMADRVMVIHQGKVTLECEAEKTNLNNMLVHAISAN
ncbi:sugar ABC transporter ATP-binding protein [Vallitalea sp.]|jgi:ribose transport system ATP-binding protein|uniref:sugar ABC transporter ATP-binding protein n=1 Tax=Vallitalea sp. TaxID=1882829 RepID=UPI0025E54249|nr:sugar ABC transporter ATP-binding protein [Vallitalea sp.]MCT4687927.1 sugar ABC transporter ATP-binding protein [Vallitalea sp.]